MSVIYYVTQFNADQGELSISPNKGKHWKRFTARSIRKMQQSEAEQKKLFFKKTVPQIEVHVSGDDNIYVFQQGILKDDFKWVSNVLRKFCEKYKIEFLEEPEAKKEA